MSQIRFLCDEILKHLTALGMRTESNLQPGLSEVQIGQLAAGLPFVLPTSVVEFYKWRNGTRLYSGVGVDFFPGFGPDPLEQSIEMYNELRNAPDFPRFRCGDMQWFPVFRSGGTDFYGVCCKDVATADGEIVCDDNEGEHRDCVTPPPVEFVSLEAMLQTLLRCYETGVYYVNDQGQLAVGAYSYNDQGQLVGVDMSKFKEVARQFNPGLKRWE